MSANDRLCMPTHANFQPVDSPTFFENRSSQEIVKWLDVGYNSNSSCHPHCRCGFDSKRELTTCRTNKERARHEPAMCMRSPKREQEIYPSLARRTPRCCSRTNLKPAYSTIEGPANLTPKTKLVRLAGARVRTENFEPHGLTAQRLNRSTNGDITDMTFQFNKKQVLVL